MQDVDRANAAGARPPSRWLGKAWLLLTIPLGLTTWAAFLYIGLRARHARWIAWAGIYAALLVGWVALDSAANASDTVVGVWVLMLILTWIGGGTHAIAISNDAVRRIRRRHDPAIEAAEAKVNLRAEGNS